jgi:hypothetical protein
MCLELWSNEGVALTQVLEKKKKSLSGITRLKFTNLVFGGGRGKEGYGEKVSVCLEWRTGVSLILTATLSRFYKEENTFGASR